MINQNASEPSLIEAETIIEPAGPRHLTQSQAAAVIQLAAMARLVGHAETYGGFRPRAIPLLFGPSGAGKTACLYRLLDTLRGNEGAETGKIGLLVVNLGSWIVTGARESAPITLQSIQRFVRRHTSGILALDEADKACPNGDAAFKSGWDLSVTTELLSLLDASQYGDQKLLTSGWTAGDIQKLKNFFVIGAGAWTRQSKRAKQENISHEQAIIADLGIPEELHMRFNARLIEVKAPNRQDFKSAIIRIHRDLEIPFLAEGPVLEKLIDSAIAANCGMRWCEQLITDLLCLHPQKIRQKQESEPENKPGKTFISHSAFSLERDNAYRLFETAEGSIVLFQVQVRLLADKLWKPEESDILDLNDRMTASKMNDHFENVIAGLNFRYAISDEDRRNREKLLWQSGGIVAEFLDSLLHEKAELLLSQQLLSRAADVKTKLFRVLTVLQYLTTLKLDDEA